MYKKYIFFLGGNQMQSESKQPFNPQPLIDQANRDEFNKKAQKDAVMSPAPSGWKKGTVRKNHSTPGCYRRSGD